MGAVDLIGRDKDVHEIGGIGGVAILRLVEEYFPRLAVHVSRWRSVLSQLLIDYVTTRLEDPSYF
jgi:hypothetical protein